MRVNTSSYSDVEKDVIRRMWPVSTHQELLDALPGRTLCGIAQKALQMGVALAPSTRRCRRGSLEPLLDGSPEAWYWLGFFLADGHMTKQGQFVVMLSDKDEDHLQTMAQFLSAKVKRPYSNPDIRYKSDCPNSLIGDSLVRKRVRIAIMDPVVCDRIRSMFGLTSSRKSENPPKVECLERLTSFQLDWLFMGFFDGDGCVGPRWASLEIHSSWRPVLDFWNRMGLVLPERPASRGKSYPIVGVRVSVLRRLHAQHGNLVPLLRRKWNNLLTS